jgi:TIGR03009 family protein
MTEADPVMKRESKLDVSIWLMTPNLARMDMAKPPVPGKEATPADKMIISTGKTLYEYDQGRKTRTRAALGPGGAGNNLLLDLMSGMKAKQVTDRFTVSTAKEDENFVFLEVKPFYAQDKEEFETLTLVLCGSKFGERKYIPRMVILKRNDGHTTETWDFPDPKVNPKGITEEYFNPVDIPRDWKDELRVLPKAPPPATGTGGVKAPAPTTPGK